MIDVLTNIFGRIEDLVRLIGTVAALIFVIYYVAKNRTMVALFQALLIAAVFVWGLYNIEFLRERVEQDANDAAVMIRPGWSPIGHLDVQTIHGALRLHLPG
jgi:hypothetical protein